MKKYFGVTFFWLNRNLKLLSQVRLGMNKSELCCLAFEGKKGSETRVGFLAEKMRQFVLVQRKGGRLRSSNVLALLIKEIFP